MALKKRVHGILEVAAKGDHASRAFDIFIVSLIAQNIAALATFGKLSWDDETVRPGGPSCVDLLPF